MNGALELPVADFIQQQRQDYWRGKLEQKTHDIEDQGVAQEPEEVERVEKIYKVLEPDPRASQNAELGSEILERDDGTIDGSIVKQNKICQGGNGKEVEGPVHGEVPLQHSGEVA